MIRIRHQDGTVSDLPPTARFVEITSSDALPAVVIYQRDDGVVNICQAGDVQFDRYCRMFGIQPAKLTKLPLKP